MNRLLAVVAVGAVALGGCQKENEAEEPVVNPKPIEEPVKFAEVTISSVSMTDDCPDPEPAPEEKRAKREAEAEDEPARSMTEGEANGNWQPPCEQSMIQLSFTGQGDSAAKVVLKEVRVLGPDGSVLGTAKSRHPTEWKDNVYTPWDQMLNAKTDAVVAYKLSIPNWTSPEAQTKGSSYGTMMRVEVDVVIGDVTRTVKSSEYTRERPEMIET